MRLFIATMVLVLGLSGTALGAGDVKTIGDGFDKAERDHSFMVLTTFRLRSILEGIKWAQIVYKEEVSAIYCLPPNIGLTEGKIYDIVRRFVYANEKYSKLPAETLGFVVIGAISEAFPCPKK